MNNAKFIDTNVLVYAYDFSEPEKQASAVAALDELHETQTGVLSTQVLSEFFVVVTKKLAAPLTIDEAAERVETLVAAWPIAEITPMVVIEATRGVSRHRLSYWDALIWATARLNQIQVILSEDFNQGHSLEGVAFVNPFYLSEGDDAP